MVGGGGGRTLMTVNYGLWCPASSGQKCCYSLPRAAPAVPRRHFSCWILQCGHGQTFHVALSNVWIISVYVAGRLERLFSSAQVCPSLNAENHLNVPRHHLAWSVEDFSWFLQSFWQKLHTHHLSPARTHALDSQANKCQTQKSLSISTSVFF